MCVNRIWLFVRRCRRAEGERTRSEGRSGESTFQAPSKAVLIPMSRALLFSRNEQVVKQQAPTQKQAEAVPSSNLEVPTSSPRLPALPLRLPAIPTGSNSQITHIGTRRKAPSSRLEDGGPQLSSLLNPRLLAAPALLLLLLQSTLLSQFLLAEKKKEKRKASSAAVGGGERRRDALGLVDDQIPEPLVLHLQVLDLVLESRNSVPQLLVGRLEGSFALLFLRAKASCTKLDQRSLPANQRENEDALEAAVFLLRLSSSYANLSPSPSPGPSSTTFFPAFPFGAAFLRTAGVVTSSCCSTGRIPATGFVYAPASRWNNAGWTAANGLTNACPASNWGRVCVPNEGSAYGRSSNAWSGRSHPNPLAEGENSPGPSRPLKWTFDQASREA